MVKSPFIATNLQVATYLLGVALFSISFLVFLNSSVSFVVTDLIGQKKQVGDAVGTLGFADELVALVACPFWGIMSDRLGVRTVVTIGYAIVGISLFVFVQARNVYPQLLLARLFFSIGGAATSTMVTAILPTMTLDQPREGKGQQPGNGNESYNDEEFQTTAGLEAPMNPSSYVAPPESRKNRSAFSSRSATSHIAGFVGMFTGLGALVALGLFLPMPARFQKHGYTPANAVKDSYYLVGSIALAVALACALGLAGLGGEEKKGFKAFVQSFKTNKDESGQRNHKGPSLLRLLIESVKLGFTDTEVAIGYIGGFVARASSVGISLFIPLYVNAYFISSGLCRADPHSSPHDIKDTCRRAYSIAAALSGVSQLVALSCAPLFGYLDGRFRIGNIPLLVAAVSGIIGYTLLAKLPSPDFNSKDGSPGSPVIFLVMALLGISQIGAIVCSLSSLGRGIQGGSEGDGDVADTETESGSPEGAPLLASHSHNNASMSKSRSHLKGTIAGVYSLAGGVGILLLTKLGGALFDSLSTGAPFYMLAIFNAVLLVVVVACGFVSKLGSTAKAGTQEVRT